MQGSSQQSAAPSDISFEDYDADFEKALLAAVLSPPSPKRKDIDGAEEEEESKRDEVAEVEEELPATEKQTYMETDAYKPNAFGDFRSYMKNKRLKLKVQEVSMSEDEARAASGSSQQVQSTTLPALFKGTNIYINGHTIPPYGELRRLLHLYGGSLMPYLDQKTPVTHIIASNLTAKKRIEFKDYKIVRPEWVTQSIEQGKRLDWRDFRCAEDASGAMKMGALQGRARVGGQSDVLRSRAEEAEQARRVAAKGDWRAATEEGSAIFAYNTSGAGPGSTGGVGPWGKGSRQKTLAGWGQKQDQDEDFPDRDNRERSKNDKEEADLPRRSQSEEAWLDNLETPPKSQSNTSIPSEVGKRLLPIPPPKETSPKAVDDKVFASLGTDPPSAAAAIAAGHRHQSHPYASRPSNIAAAQLLASPSWRQRNTATGDDFLAGFFEKSRLHHLSTWKSEMKEMVSQALREAGKEQGSVDLPEGVSRVIMHIDFDAFFVSVGLRSRPDLKQKAVVVCHGTSAQEGSNNGTLHSTSEIASCNYIARTFGIRNGMSLGQANRLCKEVHTISYDFVAYNDVAIKFYTLLLLHADALEAVSIDEALIDVSLLLNEMRTGQESEVPERKQLMDSYKDLMNSQGKSWTEEKRLAEALRDGIREATGCEASIGIGDNVLLARMATRKAKPGGSFHLRLEEFKEFSVDLDIDDLHGIGWSIRNRCRDSFGTCKIGELISKITKGKLIVEFGEKQGVTIWDKLHGRERDRLESVKSRQSCGASVNYAIRFESEQEAKDFVFKLSEEVSNRLKAIQLLGKVCSISIMVRSQDAPIEAPKFLGHGICDTFNRSAPFARPTDDRDVIFALAWKLVSALKIKPDQLRGIGVSCQKLQPRELSARPESGQGRLNFTTPVKKNSRAEEKTMLQEQKERNGASGSDEEGQEELAPGPSGKEKRRRSVTPEEEPAKKQRSGELSFPSTQFAIPPASQLDVDVISALPEKMQAQIRIAQEARNAEDHLHNTSLTGRAISTEPGLRSSPRPSSAASTPEKHRTPINPFLSMRAASATPTKKAIKQSQKRSAFEMPRLSQLDPDVLAELPDDVRQEILREAGASTSSLTPRKTSTTSGLMSSEILKRGSSSDSPRKKQRFLDMGNSKLAEEYRTPSKLNRHFDAMDVAISVSTSNRITARTLDPKQVTKEDLIRLEIDPEFFAALPEEVQRETLQEQTALVGDKQARFKSGKQVHELSLQEERRLQTQAAFAFDDNFRAKQQKQLIEVEHSPNLKGQRSLDEIRQLLDTWFNQFRTTGPRQKDVDRFVKFLLECVELVDLDQLDKVRGILKWWKALLQRWNTTAHREWWLAFDRVKGQVDDRVKVKFRATLSLK